MTTSTKRKWIKRCQHLDTPYRGKALWLLRERLKRRFRHQGKREPHPTVQAKPAIRFY